jgi:hypothetical protein
LNRIVPQDEFSLARVQVVNWLLVVVMPLAAGLAYNWTVATAILIGALISTLSFIFLKNDLTKVMKGPLQAVKIRFFITYYLRLSALAILLYVLVRYGHVHVFGLLVGLSTVVAGIVIAAASQAKNIYLSGKEAL